MATPAPLKDFDSVENTLDRLRLDRRARERGAIVTEGPTDSRVLSALFGLDSRCFFAAGGRPNVLRCAKEIGDRHLPGVVCVADRDFDDEEGDASSMWWLVFYDDADLEAMLFESDALDRFLAEWASSAKLQQFGGVNAARAAARERAQPLSVLRAVSGERGMGLRFDALDIEDLTDKKTASIRVASLVGKLSKVSEAPAREIEDALAAEPPTCPHTGRNLTRGRDLLAILSSMMRQLIASLTKQQVRNEFVERSLRLAVAQGDFDSTPFASRFVSTLDRARRQERP